jgi:hypothetical protein
MATSKLHRTMLPDYDPALSLFRDDAAAALNTAARSRVVRLPRLTRLDTGKIPGNVIMIAIRVSTTSAETHFEVQAGNAADGVDGKTAARLTVRTAGAYFLPVDVSLINRIVPAGPAYLSILATPSVSVIYGANIHALK